MAPLGDGEGTSAVTLAERVPCIWSQTEDQSRSRFQMSPWRVSLAEFIFDGFHKLTF